MSDAVTADTGRQPCPHCGAQIIAGARKCKVCKKWLVDANPAASVSKFARVFTLATSAAVTAGILLVSGRSTKIAEAPPLTAMSATPTATATGLAAPPQPMGPDRPAELPKKVAPDQVAWTARQLPVDMHPLDVVFSPSGKSIYVSADDASLREYDVKSGRLLHKAKLQAQGDRIVLVHDRYVAIVRRLNAAHIPVVDTANWDKEPTLLLAGMNPADVVALPDGKTIVTASSRGKRLSWYDLSDGKRLADLRLPHATTQLFLVRVEERPYIGAMGTMMRAGRPAGAWLDLFDPQEAPFGATRRSIAVGRKPRVSAVTKDGKAVFVVDQVSNAASYVTVDGTTDVRSAKVGEGPVAGFLLNGDKQGVTLDGRARTATVVDVKTMKRTGAVMLGGSPNAGARSPDGSTLFVSLGGPTWPPSDAGAAVIAGNPPKVVAKIPTGRGASQVAASRDGQRGAVVNYWAKAITIVERTR